MSAKETIRNDVKCAICEADIPLRTLKSDHPEAPELFAPGDYFIGCFRDEEGNVKLIATCSKEHAEKLLSE